MAIYELVMHSAEETMEFAVRLSEQLQPKDVIALEGDLGAGKTTFTKGLAKGLGITRAVSSPTFTIVKEYKGRLPLYHMDVYRLEDTFEDLGFDEYFEGDGVTVIEWAHLIKPQLPDELLYIHLYHHGDQERKMVLEPIGKRYEQLCKEIIEG
ncbi:tRNA (adenosine(37)-N6)-threonylcarbamoyltransferase complex ATPase subunit type 1 TsaE [Anoxybacillus rupiensis]|uniref:tRNA threonylcarbamoyladenosine biosynthesis protein TsaE n=1 Tax=Anoxybacteroides rupiense TaxID=311460 RepID=A0ABD5IY58_9BACL|nr:MULTISPECIES: tRNA (adenosine(37)-N6)-threonylcarbamoyltransferase complex ATPase subunit type 1 TsaE [Anoxybacillus]KXG08290.1 tRNA threonylcarbamoyladenosine biosynthesis protein TsaE [Anoxybacillus sp. P3H1B]MBB3909337.1 tRNA threonylcarbamoyladenosine biosynthesis protein TsaE [Anoxybacillus rupiensis]MBS2773059.1 tRNA (adenosine(37)-N6)-threonylcarbamoyltransferase complex ATPase subunit type 1 TsaE [Anoxybacillus rupiensis]MDE8565649.1 tRNA (adenosine(37)-N6)-threonylcarbamoyltransfera